ncbi:hypothetical protein MMC10_008720 [Thelotrema lepadinum]|nr:hypothetical protein [Thelotrema lepadinum]
MVVATLSLAQESSIVYFPPQDDASDTINDFTVTAGDTINITWSATYSSVDLRIEGSAPNTNWTVTPFFNPGLESNSFFNYVLQPRDYLVNDSSTLISAYFLLSDHADTTQFIKTQNFTIQQPIQESINPQGQFTIPPDASTWTGSVTLLKSQGGEQFVTGSAPASQTTGSESATTSTGTASITSTTPSGTAGLVPAISASASSVPINNNDSSSSLSTSAKIGIGVGVALGILLITGMIILSLLLARSRRKAKAASQPMPLIPSASEKPGQVVGGGWQYQNSYAPGSGAGPWLEGQLPPAGEHYKSELSATQVLIEIDGSSPGIGVTPVSELDGVVDRRAELGGEARARWN